MGPKFGNELIGLFFGLIDYLVHCFLVIGGLMMMMMVMIDGNYNVKRKQDNIYI
jgi:hypothetical protein